MKRKADIGSSEPERDSLVDRHGFDAVMRGFLSVPRKAEEGEKAEEAGEAPRRKPQKKLMRKK